MTSEDDRRAIWDEAFRRAAGSGGDPEQYFRAMIQETLNGTRWTDGSIETVGLNEHGQMVYRKSR